MDIFDIIRTHTSDLERKRLLGEAPVATVEPTVKKRTKLSEFTPEEIRDMPEDEFLALEQDL